MKHPASSNKATRQTDRIVQQHRSAGDNAVALTPPAYGIEFADSASPRSPQQSSGGKTMPNDVRFKMEEAFGEDFSQVRLHEGSLAQSVGALAATQGADIHFAPGAYMPHSQQGQQLLGHELAHVVQQASGRVSATTQHNGFGINTDRRLEREADDVAVKAVRGERVRLQSDSIGHTQDRASGQNAPAVQKKDSSGVVQCLFGSVAYEKNVWPVVTGRKTTNLKNDFGDFKVEHGLTTDPGTGGTGEYKIEIEMTPNKKTEGSTIRFVQAVRRGTAPGKWSAKATDPGMTADRERRAAAGGWRVDRADPTTDKTPFYGHEIDSSGTLKEKSNAKAGTFGGTKPYLYDAPDISDPLALEFSSDAVDDKTGTSFGKVAWGLYYSSADKTYKEETPRMLPMSTNWFLNLFSEDRRRIAGERAGREKWNEVYGTGGKGTTAGDADVKKVLGV